MRRGLTNRKPIICTNIARRHLYDTHLGHQPPPTSHVDVDGTMTRTMWLWLRCIVNVGHVLSVHSEKKDLWCFAKSSSMRRRFAKSDSDVYSVFIHKNRDKKCSISDALHPEVSPRLVRNMGVEARAAYSLTCIRMTSESSSLGLSAASRVTQSFSIPNASTYHVHRKEKRRAR